MTPYRLLDVAEVAYQCRGSNRPSCLCRVRIYQRGPDRPYLVIAEHVVRSGGGNLASLAIDAAREVSFQHRIPLECMLWVNRLGGKRGGYSRRSERLSFVDVQSKRNWPFEVPSYPTSRKVIESRYGIVLPDVPNPIEAVDHPLIGQFCRA